MSTLTTQASPSPAVKVSFHTHEGPQNRTFQQSFRIGRLQSCEVCIDNEYVGRVHAEMMFENGKWWIRDLQSRNGIYVGEHRLELVAIIDSTKVRLGKFGPELTLEPDVPPTDRRDENLDHYVQHYFADNPGGAPAGERTIQVRRAFARVQKVQKRKQRQIIGGLILLIIAIGSYATYESIQVRHQRAMAKDLFYAIKSLDVEISNLERASSASGQQNEDAIRSYESRRRELENSYDRFLSSLRIYDPKITEQQRIMLRVARLFGECELDMPAGFEEELNRYIDDWRSSGRLVNALRTARANHYDETIPKELVARGLPPQFFYLALQESNFDPMATGPVTRFGIAKGMWQFMPNTALAYGLRVGPLVELRQPDPLDERHQAAKATKAAVRYLKDLYSTDAQASGFLVMASYNWGENRVLPLIRSMPPNPRDRNFWQLLSKYRSQIPQETYDYVFHIVSAAVICENPRLFGFDFDNPLVLKNN